MLAAARREPSAILLFAQLAAVLLYPFTTDSDAGQALFNLIGIGILVLVLLAVRSTPALTWVAVLLGLPATVLLVIQAVTVSDDLQPYSAALEAALYFYAAGALISYMLADHRITRDELFAVGATFTLVAWAFAYTFVVCQAIAPGSFTAAVDPSADRTWMELLFLSFTTLSSTGLSDVVPIEPQSFTAAVDPTADRSWVEVLFLSFTTLTSTGLSDVIPVKPFARSLVMIEQLAGLAYVAVLVSRLVALTVHRANGAN